MSINPSSGKIRIKPLRQRDSAGPSTPRAESSVAPIPTQNPAVDDAPHMSTPREADEDMAIDAVDQPGDDYAADTPRTPAVDEDIEEVNDVDVPDGGAETGGAGVEDDGDVSEPAIPMPRPRGRPRGRGRGALIGSARARGGPRGRPRGRGRGRGGRGSGVTIRLPKRIGEDGEEDVVATPGEMGPEDYGTLGADGLVETYGEYGEVLGGGKPFRKIQGQVYIIDGDEFVTDDDPKGDEKIDKWGNLLGGRKFKAQTFTLPKRHPERMYMLAIDAARTSGFRDSLYYFRRNPLAFKCNATQPEKEYLIEIGKLGSHLRTRSVTLITARSAYKLHGAKMIQDGRWVVDDYFEEKSLAEITAKGLQPGDLVGELVDPNAAAAAAANAAANDASLASQKADRGSGMGMYRAGGPTTIFGGSGWGPYSDGPLNAVRKSLLNRDGLNEENWMLIAAQRTSEASAAWARQRKGLLRGFAGSIEGTPRTGVYKDSGREKRDAEEGGGAEDRKTKKLRHEAEVEPRGVYEPHNAVYLYRADTQPTRSRWEGLPDSAEKHQVLGGSKAGGKAWALAWVDTVMEIPPDQEDEDSEAARERARILASVSS